MDEIIELFERIAKKTRGETKKLAETGSRMGRHLRAIYETAERRGGWDEWKNFHREFKGGGNGKV